GKGEERVAGFDVFAAENIFAFDDADDESGEIVFADRIEAGHFRGFAADEGAACFAAGAAHAVDELLDDVGFELAHGEIVEEEERFGALDENVVDAMVDEIAADG